MSGDEQAADPIPGVAQRERILAAAGAIFIEKGFEAVTTREIAAQARVSKRDLYRLFANKQGILEALIAAHSENLATPAVLEEPLGHVHLLEILRNFGRAFLASYLDPRKLALYRMAIAEAPRSTALGEALAATGAAPVAVVFATFMRAAITRGLIAAEDADLVSSTYFDVLIGSWPLRLLTGTHAVPDAGAVGERADKAAEVVRRLIGGAKLKAD